MRALLDEAAKLLNAGQYEFVALLGGDHGLYVTHANLGRRYLTTELEVAGEKIRTPDELGVLPAFSTFGELLAYRSIGGDILCERSSMLKAKIHLLALGLWRPGRSCPTIHTVTTGEGGGYNFLVNLDAIIDPWHLALRWVEKPIKQWIVPWIRSWKQS